MERENLKRAIAGGVVTVALGWTGISFLGGDKEAPAAPPKPKVVKVESEIQQDKAKDRKTVAVTSSIGRRIHEERPDLRPDKPARHRNSTEQPVKRKQPPCG